MIDFSLVQNLFWNTGDTIEFPIREELATEAEWVEGLATYYTQHPDQKHGLYDEATARAHNLSLHFDYDSDISDKIKQRRPTESKSSNEYRNQAWEPINYGWMQKPLIFLQKIFNKQLTEISFGQVENTSIKEGEDLQTYLEEKLPKYRSLSNYNRTIALRAMMQDPDGWNAVHSIKPQSELDRTELPRPVPSYIPSSAVVDYDEDFVIVLTNEKVELANQDYSGLVYWVFTKIANYRVFQYGEKEDATFEAQIVDFHNKGKKSIEQLGGVPRLDKTNYLTEESKVAFDSHIQPAIPFLNKLISLDSDIDAMFALHMFLQKIELEMKCEKCEGKGVTVHEEKGYKCQACEGTGYDSTSVFDTYKVKPEALELLGGLPDVAKYIQVPTDIVKVAIEREKEYLFNAYQALNMEFLIEEKTLTGQTAESKRLDRDSLYVMLENVAKDVFRVAQFNADWINTIRYGTVLGNNVELNGAKYKVPVRFDVENEAQVISQLKELSSIESAPTAYLQKMFIQAAKNRFGEDTRNFRFTRASILLDPLFGLDEGAIFSAEAQGRISKKDSYTHFNIVSLINEALTADENFLKLPLEMQKEIIAVFVPETEIIEKE